MYEQAPPTQNPPKKGMSTGAKIGCGCGIVVLLLVLVCGGAVYYFYNMFMGEVKRFQDQGYTLVSNQSVRVTTPVDQPTVYFAQETHIDAPVNANISIIGQTADIRANVNGDIDFYGQMLTIHPGVVVTGDVRVNWAQLADIRGTVQGKISGSDQRGPVVQNPPLPGAPSAPATPSMPPDSPPPAPEAEPSTP